MSGFGSILLDYKNPLSIIIWVLIGLNITGFCYIIFVQTPDNIAKDKAERLSLDQMSCQQLGQWIIKKAPDNIGEYESANYAYAQAKYLVCTHTGASP